MIIRWILHYSRKEPNENLWTKYPLESRQSFIEKISNIFDTGGHKPVSKDVFSPYDSLTDPRSEERRVSKGIYFPY